MADELPLLRQGVAGPGTGSDLQADELPPHRSAIGRLGDHLLAHVAALGVADRLLEVGFQGDGVLAQLASPARDATEHAGGLYRRLAHRAASRTTGILDQRPPLRGRAAGLAP